MAHSGATIGRKRVALFVCVLGLALGLNIVAWVGASFGSNVHELWKYVSLASFFLLGLLIGRWWALLVTLAFAVIHAIPVYMQWLPGYLSTWGEALWWAFGLVVLLALTALGVLARVAVRRVQRRFAA